MKISPILMFMIAVTTCSCQRFLDLKPDKKMLLPEKLEDVQAMLDNVSRMNLGSTGLAEIGADNYFLPLAAYNSFSVDEYRDSYTWRPLPSFRLHWLNPYGTAYSANAALDALKSIGRGENNVLYDVLEGSARFYRAHVMFNMLQVFAKQYNPQSAKFDMGIVLVSTSDVNAVYQRSSVDACYAFIINDLKIAEKLLQEDRAVYPTRPTRLAADALLANVYLQQMNYTEARFYADRVLDRYNVILNYKDIVVKRFPFDPYNKEVLFYSRMICQTNLMPANARIPQELLDLYSDEDTRKELFFSRNSDGSYSFTGNYSAIDNNTQFNGLTVPEMLLIQAECLIRENQLQQGKQSLLDLSLFRYKGNSFKNKLDNVSMSKEDLLKVCLEERRRELVFRGRRWLDLRRCTKDELGVDRLYRSLDATYSISLEELKNYAYYIPAEVVEQGSVIQN